MVKIYCMQRRGKFVGAGFSQGETTRTPFPSTKHKESQIVHGKF